MLESVIVDSALVFPLMSKWQGTFLYSSGNNRRFYILLKPVGCLETTSLCPPVIERCFRSIRSSNTKLGD